MARLPRYTLPGQLQHVIQRGNNSTAVFLSDNDYRFYLHALRDACAAQSCEVHAYVLMPNHVHLLITPGRESGISKAMQSVGGRYSQHINSTYGRKGTLWEGRYRSTVIDADAYLLHCMRYIELNPVRAGIVPHAWLYRWSSCPRNARGHEDKLISPHVLYRQLGESPDAQQKRYEASFPVQFDELIQNDIRNATNKGWVLGSREFIARIETMVKRRAQPLPRGGDRRNSHTV
jgi:putative transposase